jgi:hypothetical protein
VQRTHQEMMYTTPQGWVLQIGVHPGKRIAHIDFAL